MKGRVLALDGLRGVAIALVLWLHLAIGGFAGLRYPETLGRLGVALFFALSGFLITHILLQEPIGLARFWKRRALRIFPAFYVYLATVAVLWALKIYSLTPVAFFAAGTYWMNFYSGYRGWPLDHTWSLAIEEQFYLLWPIVLKLLGPKRSAALLSTFLLLWPFQRYFRTGHWGHPDISKALFSVTFDAIFWGCLFALFYHEMERRKGSASPLGPYPPLGILGLLLLWPHMFPIVMVPILRNASLAWLVSWVALGHGGIVRRLLETAPLVWLGQRSYSLYLWHMIFCDPRLAGTSLGVGWILVACLVSEVSFRGIEQPILRWRDRRLGGKVNPLCGEMISRR